MADILLNEYADSVEIVVNLGIYEHFWLAFLPTAWWKVSETRVLWAPRVLFAGPLQTNSPQTDRTCNAKLVVWALTELDFWLLSILYDYDCMIMNQIIFYLVHNQKGNCQYDHITFNLKGIKNLAVSLWVGILVNESLPAIVHIRKFYLFARVEFWIWNRWVFLQGVIILSLRYY